MRDYNQQYDPFLLHIIRKKIIGRKPSIRKIKRNLRRTLKQKPKDRLRDIGFSRKKRRRPVVRNIPIKKPSVMARKPIRILNSKAKLAKVNATIKKEPTAMATKAAENIQKPATGVGKIKHFFTTLSKEDKQTVLMTVGISAVVLVGITLWGSSKYKKTKIDHGHTGSNYRK